MDPELLTADKSADSLAEPFVEARSEILATPGNIDQDTAETVANDLALEALLASAAEYDERGWAQVGSPSVIATEVESIDPEADPPVAVLEVCLDYAEVDIVDTAGESVRDTRAATRVLNLYELQFVDGRWVLVNQTFTDETSC